MNIKKNSFLDIKCGIPQSARELIWKVFFTSRNRGVSFNAHFPWANTHENLYCISVNQLTSENTASTVACLILKAGSDSKSNVNVGLIGLVCVAESFRGEGLSTLLLNEAIILANQKKLDCLMLWTQKPGVYAKHGFDIDHEEIFGVITKGTTRQPAALDYTTQCWSDFAYGDNPIALPPFASNGKKNSSSAANVIVLESQSIPTVVEWFGSAADVADLLIASLPKQWGLNLTPQDDLYTELTSRNCTAQLMNKTFCLVKKLTPSASIPAVKFLQRI